MTMAVSGAKGAAVSVAIGYEREDGARERLGRERGLGERGWGERGFGRERLGRERVWGERGWGERGWGERGFGRWARGRRAMLTDTNVEEEASGGHVARRLEQRVQWVGALSVSDPEEGGRHVLP